MGHVAIRGFALTVAGCPYIFTTGGVATATSSDPLWFGGETGVQMADGWLFWPDIVIKETARPLDGDVDVDPIRLKLHDAIISSGPASGYNLSTFLFTQDAVNVASSLLTTTLSAAGVSSTSIELADATAFEPDTFAWIEQECVRVTAKVGNTLTVVRGRLGTKTVEHTLDAGDGLRPELYAKLPWSVRRKVTLWAIDHEMAARPIWVGATGAAPDLTVDGITFEMPCDPLWNVIKESNIGSAKGTVSLTGANGQPFLIFGCTIACKGAVPPVSCSETPGTQFASFDAAAESFAIAATAAARTLASVSSQNATCTYVRQGNRASFVLDMTFTAGNAINEGLTRIVMRGHPEDPWNFNHLLPMEVVDQGSNRWTITWTIENCPTVAYGFRTDGSAADTFGVRDTLPVNISLQSAGADPGRAIAVRTGLRADLSDDWWLVLTNLATDDTTRTMTARGGIMPRKAGAVRPGRNEPFGWLQDPRPLQVVLSVQAEHWADGWRYGVLPQLDSTVDADWDWTLYDRLIWTTRGPQATRHWVLDDQRSVAQILGEACLLNGCSLGTRNGKLALIPWQLPRSGAVAVAEFTSADLVGTGGTPWQIWREGFANTAVFSSDTVKLNLEDGRSVRRYGKGRTITIDTTGVELTRLADLQPSELYRQMLSRLALWADPVSVVNVQTSLTRMFDVFQGDLIRITDWCAPNGVGGRGLAAEAGIVLGRTLDIATGTLTLETLLFRKFAHGYAPCVKARAVAPVSSTIVQLDPLPVRGVEDYAGSVQATLNDAGSSKFTSGAIVRAIRRDTETVFEETLTLANAPTFDGTYYRFTFTAPMSGDLQALLSTGAWIEFTLDTYANATAEERSYAWIGDDTTLTIGGTTDPPHRIAP